MVMRVYSPEFKADAVALYHSDPDLTIVQASRDLGVHAETLRSWIRRGDRAGTGGGRTTRTDMRDTEAAEASREELEAEIAALRRENAGLRKDNATLATERDILRKATKFFASEMTW
jgi:transposase